MNEILAFFATIAEVILSLGYPGILIALLIEGIGIPFPGDAFLIFYGFSAASGKIQVAPAWIIAMVGYFAGTTCAFLIARRLGDKLLNNLEHFRFLNSVNVRAATNMMSRYRLLLLAPGRLLPGIRAIASYAAGISQVDFPHFLVYTCIGSGMWTSLWFTLGYWFGENMNEILHTAQTSLTYVSLGILALLIGLWFIRKRFGRV